MNAEHVLLYLIGAFLISGGWYQVIGLWRDGRDVAANLGFAIDDSNRERYNAAYGPLVLGVTSGCFGVPFSKGYIFSDWAIAEQAQNIGFGLMIFSFLFSGFMYLTGRPRFLVPRLNNRASGD